jgi:integrase
MAKKTKTLPDMIKEYIGWKKLGASDNTISSYEWNLGRFNKFCFTEKLNPLKRETLHSYISSVKKRKLKSGRTKVAKGITLNQGLTVLKSFFQYFVDSGQILANPAALIPRFKEEAATIIGFTPDEAKVLLKASHSDKNSDYWTPMILLGWHYGMRLGDTACFQRPFVDFTKKRVNFIPMKRKRKEIILPLHPDVDLALSKVPLECGQYFFPLGRDRYYFGGSLSTQFKDIVRSAGLGSTLTFHCLRHGAATRMIKAGVRTTTITEIIGWESPAMLQRYIDRDEEDIALALEGSITV